MEVSISNIDAQGTWKTAIEFTEWPLHPSAAATPRRLTSEHCIYSWSLRAQNTSVFRNYFRFELALLGNAGCARWKSLVFSWAIVDSRLLVLRALEWFTISL